MCDEETVIRKLYEASVAALNARNIPALATFYTEDAIQLPPDRPLLVGWEAIRTSLENELNGIAIEAGVELEELEATIKWVMENLPLRMEQSWN